MFRTELCEIVRDELTGFVEYVADGDTLHVIVYSIRGGGRYARHERVRLRGGVERSGPGALRAFELLRRQLPPGCPVTVTVRERDDDGALLGEVRPAIR